MRVSLLAPKTTTTSRDELSLTGYWFGLLLWKWNCMKAAARYDPANRTAIERPRLVVYLYVKHQQQRTTQRKEPKHRRVLRERRKKRVLHSHWTWTHTDVKMFFACMKHSVCICCLVHISIYDYSLVVVVWRIKKITGDSMHKINRRRQYMYLKKKHTLYTVKMG